MRDGQSPFFSPHICTVECDGPTGCQGRKEEGRWERVRQAKAICAACPVQGECLTWAIEVNLADAIAGGMTDNERRKYKK